jgi:branched-chain amino acid transport system substrate-binding protein
MTKFAITLGIGLAIAAVATPALAQESIKIGAMVPLTGGSYSIVGEDLRRGFVMAIDEANKAGGYQGKKFEMILGDTQANPTIAVGLVQRLLVRDKVAALVGLYSSTEDKAVGAIVGQYKTPTFVTGGASTIVEDAYGMEPWFFHFFPWEYQRAESYSSFLKTLTPKPKTVAIAYESGVYGSGAAPLYKQVLEADGFQIVAMESFKSGSPSLLPLLSRLKSETPDIVLVQGFPADDILIVKQSREVDLAPKLMMLPELFPKTEYGGTPIDDLIGSATWIPESTYPESVKWLADFRARYPDRPQPQEWAPLGYTAMKMMLTAIADVGPGSEAIIHRLEAVKLDSPFGPVGFHDSRNSHHQVLSQLNIIQYQDGNKLIVYPPELAGKAQVRYPAPAWNDRKN